MNEIMPFAAPVEGSRDCHAKWNKSDRGRQILHVIIYMWNLKKSGTNEFIYKTEIDSQM